MPSCCAPRKCIRVEVLNDAPLQIEIAYAEPQRGIVKTLHLPAGSRVADALRLAALDPDFTGVDLANSPLGIFGKLVRTDQVLAQHPLEQGIMTAADDRRWLGWGEAGGPRQTGQQPAIELSAPRTV